MHRLRRLRDKAMVAAPFPSDDNHVSRPTARQQLSFEAALLAFESNVRKITDEQALIADLCNSPRRFLNFRQAILMRRRVKGGALQAAGVSSLPSVDRNTPFIQWIEKLLARASEKVPLDQTQVFSASAYADADDVETSSYPFQQFLWTPMKSEDGVIAGVLMARETDWSQRDVALAERVTGLYSHAWFAIKGRRITLRSRLIDRKRAVIAACLLLLLSMFPVNITALAPATVTPQSPFVVAAPFNGVVREINVNRGDNVMPGDVLVTFENIHQRNDFEIAVQAEAVATARYQQSAQRAISDPRAKRELPVYEAELELAKAEKAYAQEQLRQTVIEAERTGVVVLSDKQEWIGKPVAAGEAIMQIAAPSEVDFTIDLPVGESLVLKTGARVRVFLDSDPLNPIEATLKEAAYQARADERNIMSYRLSAVLVDDELKPTPDRD